jgi:ATP-binding cassette subfamily B multidrug efflux pump
MGLVSVVGDLLYLGAIVVVMLLLDWRLALITFAVLPLLLLVVAIFRRLTRQAQRLIRRRVAQINATTQEHITGMSIVQIFGRQRQALGDFDDVNRAHRDAYYAAIRYDASLFAIVELLGSLTVALLLWYGGVRVLGGSVSFGLLVAFIEYVQRFFIPIRDMSVKYMAMQQAMAASERVFDLLDTATERDAPPHPATSVETPGAGVAFDRVSFAYLPGQPVLHDVSFAVRPGESIAVVGATGSGKSTLVRLLSRLYELESGAIALDGHDISELSLDELRRRVVVVSQDVFLFSGTVASNISLGDPAISRERIEAAARRVGLTRLLDLDHEVQERGANLSAGERQLVAFARALVRDPEVLVLDEATSSVDPEAEKLVQEGTAELMRERTAIVIAHRLSTIERAHRILVLHHGAIVEQGSHEELLAAGGVYSRLYQLQYVNNA